MVIIGSLAAVVQVAWASFFLPFYFTLDEEALHPQDTNSGTIVPHNGIVARRRKTMPPMVLQKEIAEFRKQQKGIENATVFWYEY